MSTTLKQDVAVLQQMLNELSPQERQAPANKITTVKQVQVVGLAIACQLRAIAETEATREALKGAK